MKKPFPLGFALGSAALAAVLIGILVFAAQHQGLGDRTSLIYAQSQIDGIINTTGLKATHVDGAVNYPNQATMPPVGGNHNSVPQSCQAYTAAIANEHAVHSLEHGAVWVTYNPDDVSAADVSKLKALVNGNSYQMLSPYPGLKSAISLQAWGEQVFVNKVSDKRIKRFLDLFTHGPQLTITKEPNAACQGTTATGPLAPVVVPPSPSATPSASPSPAK